jgi:deazaflavin-dependent oxidoreductase (nitroreductase family)
MNAPEFPTLRANCARCLPAGSIAQENSTMPAASRNALSEFFFRIHPWIYRKTGGRIAGKIGPAPILLLHTRGRKTGAPRTNALMYLERADGWAITASWAGEPKHPVWFLNLMAQPDVTIQLGRRELPVRARALEGEERERVWEAIVAQDPSFQVYEERTRGVREIPVVLLEPRAGAGEESAEMGWQPGTRVMYGLSCSYFTGKLEAYLRAKGIPFRLEEMSSRQFRACGIATGVVQLPCLREPDGRWLTDTTAILDHFEEIGEGPDLRPADPAMAFLSLLFEDLFDEWLWRPALYYRWAHPEDARLMSTELARVLLRDVPLPLFVRRWFVLVRQKIVYLKKDGVTKQTAPAIEALYLDSLRELEYIFTARPFLFGDRPCEADFGLFGPFFRHFFCDPTSGGLMRSRAPRLAQWVTRLWALRPEDVGRGAPIERVPPDLGFFFRMISEDYLPYLAANAQAVASDVRDVRYRAQGVDWQIPAAPYRAECLNALKRRFAALDAEAAETIAGLLSERGIGVLRQPIHPIAMKRDRKGRLGRLGRPSAALD